MAYTPTNWSTGDTITATKLNKLENGVANSGGRKYPTVTVNITHKTEDHSWFSFGYAKYENGSYNALSVRSSSSNSSISSWYMAAKYDETMTGAQTISFISPRTISFS